MVKYVYVSENKVEEIKDLSTKQILNKLYPIVSEEELDTKVCADVTKFVTYDAECVQSVENFQIIAQNTECIFASKAKIWGSPPWDTSKSVGQY